MYILSYILTKLAYRLTLTWQLVSQVFKKGQKIIMYNRLDVLASEWSILNNQGNDKYLAEVSINSTHKLLKRK